MAFEEIQTDVEQIVAQKQAQYRAAVLEGVLPSAVQVQT